MAPVPLRRLTPDGSSFWVATGSYGPDGVQSGNTTSLKGRVSGQSTYAVTKAGNYVYFSGYPAVQRRFQHPLAKFPVAGHLPVRPEPRHRRAGSLVTGNTERQSVRQESCHTTSNCCWARMGSSGSTTRIRFSASIRQPEWSVPTVSSGRDPAGLPRERSIQCSREQPLSDTSKSINQSTFCRPGAGGFRALTTSTRGKCVSRGRLEFSASSRARCLFALPSLAGLLL